MRQQSWILGLSTAFLLAANGCPSEDGPKAAPDAGAAQDGPWADIYEQVIVPNGCDSAFCHGNAGELNLSLDSGYESLMGGAAKGPECVGKTSKKRVEPGDPDASLLVEKLMDKPSCGARMPLSPQPPVTAAQLELVRAWITDGAKK